MTPKSVLPEPLRKEISSHNKVWFDKYQTESNNRKEYYPNIQEFLEFCACNNDKEMHFIDRNDVDLYVATLRKYTDSPSTINRRLSVLAGFGKFLRSQYPRVFGERFLSDLPPHEHTDKNPTDIKALSLEQLSHIKKYNHRSVKDQYIFELFFQLGIDKNDLIECKFPSTRNTQLDEIIKKVPPGEVTEGTINSYFTRVTKHLKKQGVYQENRRSINSYDLAESHKAYFLKCPNCKRTLENITKNWVLAKAKFDNANYQDEYRIVCVQCKGASKK